ncbi:MAG TPA: YgeY family selenium metabolism-linked hydrolase [Anaerolineae bacterium]|nr:YgeY family selenium metabolism-linked hydrolase [Anaerolineae bacterium]HPL30199.1 YgeY family selenium metabolism-linked hydrolase [Anaerolineae bacterium]
MSVRQEHDVIEFCRDLVRRPSPPGEESAVAEAVQARMRDLGYDQVTVDAWGNVVGRIDGHRPGPSLLLDAHMDTVTVDEPERWTHDPFGAEIVGDRLYGRGAIDCKGCLAAIVSMAALLDRDRLAGTVYVSGTVIEELSEGAGLAKVCQAIAPDGVIIAEGTALELGVAQKGRASVVVEAKGKPAHAANPTEGVNAVYKMLPALTRLRDLPLRADSVVGPQLTELAELIELNSAPYPSNSVVPYHCRARYDCRMRTGETPAALLARWQALAGDEVTVSIRRQTLTCYTGAQIEVEDFYPAWYTPPEATLRSTAQRALREIGQEAKDFVAHYCTNGSYCGGVAGLPTLIYGPGVMQHAHMTDEFVEIPQVVAATQGYAAIVSAMLAA